MCSPIFAVLQLNDHGSVQVLRSLSACERWAGFIVPKGSFAVECAHRSSPCFSSMITV